MRITDIVYVSCILLYIFTLASSPVCAQLNTMDSDRGKITEGWQIAAFFEKPAIAPGNTAVLTIIITNTSKIVRDLCETSSQADFLLTISDEKGKVLLRDASKQSDEVLRRSFNKVLPGESFVTYYNISEMFKFKRCGTYRILVQRMLATLDMDGVRNVASNTALLFVSDDLSSDFVVIAKLQANKEQNDNRILEINICNNSNILRGVDFIGNYDMPTYIVQDIRGNILSPKQNNARDGDEVSDCIHKRIFRPYECIRFSVGIDKIYNFSPTEQYFITAHYIYTCNDLRKHIYSNTLIINGITPH